LGRLSQLAEIGQFYLAGGTGLALQIGHRVSDDLDWFTSEDFDSSALSESLREIGPVRITRQRAGTLVVVLEGIETGFYRYTYPLLFLTESFRGVKVASWKDILCMKLVATGQRAAKRDYVDIYFGLHAGLTLEELLDLVRRKYGEVEYSEYHLVRSLNYFDEVETQPMPEMLRPVSWEEIRSFLATEVHRLGSR
jgi:hypothetical protein